MPHRIEVKIKDGFGDALGEKTARRIREDLGLSVDLVRTVSVYTIDAKLTEEQLVQVAEGPFSDPVIQEPFVNKAAAFDFEFDWLVEVGFRPGVTDNAGRTAREAAAVRTGQSLQLEEGVYTSTQFLLKGDLTPDQAESVARDLLANELIQRWTIVPATEFDRENGIEAYVPKVIDAHEPTVKTFDLDGTDDDLMRISREGTLALSLKEMKTIRDYFKRPDVIEKRATLGMPDKPTDVEVETLAQTWSEHCKHKIFNAAIKYKDGDNVENLDSIFDLYVRGSTEKIRKDKGEADFCLSVFKDNAGVIRFNEDWSLVMKVETHNSPSALDPYGGALTGIVGVNRDPFGTGMGAKLVFNVDTFCFATPFWDKPLPPRLLHPKRVLEGVREGVEHGGNKSGIPTVDGGLVFDDRYSGKPLVFCGTGAIMPTKVCGKPSEDKAARPGDLIVMCGGRIGKDGIHGATFSSEQLHAGSPATAVQIGDPITQKRMTDFLLVARDKCLYSCITDNGAGGLSSSIGETAEDSGGCVIDLEKAPLKYAGLDPWEILLSEAQERMTIAVPPEKIDAFMALSEKMQSESTVIGQYTDSGLFHIRFDGKTVACIGMDFLHDGNPQLQLSAVWEQKTFDEPEIAETPDLSGALSDMLMRLNVCSKEYVVRQYDHEVQAGSVVKPMVGVFNDGPTDAAVWRPLLDSNEAVVVSNGICPKFSDLDSYQMMAGAIDEAVRNAVAVGGDVDYMAGLDNFCWCDPEKSERTPDGEYKLAQLVRACKSLYDITTVYGVPCISGKDSMKNDFHIGDHKISIPPTVLFSVVGRMADATKAVTMDFKTPDDLVYVLGVTRDEMGGSEYFAKHGCVGNSVPVVNAEENLGLYRKMRDAIYAGLIRSCHDCSDGGLGTALAESAFAGDLGLTAELSKVPADAVSRNDHLLFSESHGRFVVSVSPGDQEAFESTLAGVTFALIGKTTSEKKLVLGGLTGETVVSVDINALKTAWKSTLDF
jgi:phosphoribosylformylglycinamidine synthase subunit PurSL